MTEPSEDLYRAVFESSPDGVFVVDARGEVRDLNPRAAEMFGYEQEELLGHPVEVLVPDGSRGGHERQRETYVRDPDPRPMGIGLELRGRRKDGTEFPVEISLSPLRSDEGPMTIATVRDTTQRRRLRDFGTGALRASEEERQRIARELHDDTAQHLATLLVRLKVLQETGVEGEDWRGRLDDFRSELKECAEGVRRIARGLRPPELQDAGLVAALRSHLRVVEQSTELAVSLDADPVDSHLHSDSKLVVYRVIQEAVSNAVRHAGASTLEVRLGMEEGRILAEVTDDGRGFEPDEAPRNGEGLGLLGMQERAVMVGGRLAIRSGPGEGTEVRLTIPVGTTGPARRLETRETEHA